MSMDLTTYIQAVGGLLLILALIGVAVWLFKRFGGARGKSGGRRGRRLAVSEATIIDKRRRLVLVRRDNLEHLVMIGGAQDVVIETGITPPAADMATAPGDAEPKLMRRSDPAPPRAPAPELPRERPPAPRAPEPPPITRRPPPESPLPRTAPPPPPPSPPAPAATPERATERYARPLTSARTGEPGKTAPFSDRPPPESLKPDPAEADLNVPPRQQSILNVRPGEDK
jgi:hypothetical protein